MNKILLLGPPGAGKGTQADIICNSLGIPKISTGDMLRSAIASGSELGKKVTDIMNSGALVSDQIIIELILDRIAQADCANGFLFDGGIRNVGKADLCVENNIEFTAIDVDDYNISKAKLKEVGIEDFFVPQIFVDGVPIGGFSDLKKIFGSDMPVPKIS